MVRTELYAKAKNKVRKDAKTKAVLSPRNKIILKKKTSLEQTKSHNKKTTPKKTKSLHQPAIEKTPSESPTEPERTPRRSSPRFKNISSPTAEKSAATRSSLGKRKSLAELESVAPSQPLRSKSKEVIEKQNTVRRKLYQSTVPCPNVQLRDPNDTFADMVEDDEDKDEPEDDVDAEEGEGEDNEIENDGGNGIASNENETEDEVSKGKEKRKYVPRGPSRMASLGLTDVPKDKPTISFNNKDQPICSASVQLASVLGVLVRRNISLTCKDWRMVHKDVKDNIWKIIKMRFIVDDLYKDYYYGRMGCYLKEARSRKAGQILALDELEEEERRKKIKELKPQNMSDNEWEAFVKNVCSQEFREKRLQMQEIRKKHTTPHTNSREGFARLEKRMQKEKNTTEEIDKVEMWKASRKQKAGKEPNPGVVEALEKIARVEEENRGAVGSSVTDDLLVKALGDDKPGRLKGVGFGVTKTKMAARSHYKKILKECQENMMEMNDRLNMLEERSARCVCCHVGSHLQKPSPKSANASNINDSTSMVHEDGSPFSRLNVVQEPVGVPAKHAPCKLLSWYVEGEIVADAFIAETDPKQKVHGKPIGFGAYKVGVKTSLVDDALVYKETTECQTILQAVGNFITWGKEFIVLG